MIRKFKYKKAGLAFALLGLGLVSPANTAHAVNLSTPPIVIEEGKTSDSQMIKNLEDSILKADISYAASKYLLENSPETIKSIKTNLEGQMAEADLLLSESRALLDKLKPATAADDQLKDLRIAYRKNLISLEAANMLLKSTPQTIKKVEKNLQKEVNKSQELINQTKDLIERSEKREAYKVRDIDRKTLGLFFSSPSEEEVLAYWRNYKSNAQKTKEIYGLDLIDRDSSQLYNPPVNLANEDPGKLSDIALRDINHITNTIRYSLGLDEVAVSNEKSHYAQAASTIFFMNKDYDHKPALPAGLNESSKLYQDAYKGASSSNIHVVRNSIDIVRGYILDADDTNWDRVGHRRWLLNPFAENFGYGLYEDYTATYVFQDSYPKPDREIVAYPSNVGISEFFHKDAPFSFSYTNNFDVSNVSITMTNLNTGRKVKYETGKNISIDTNSYGKLNSLTWGLGLTGNHGDQYEVEIDGVKYKGEDYPINYTTNFISLELANK